EALPSLLPTAPKDEAPALAATGTDGPGGEPSLPPAYRLAYRTGEAGDDSLRVSESEAGGDTENAAGRKPLFLQGFAAGCDSLRATDGRVGEGARTPDLQIHSLTL